MDIVQINVSLKGELMKKRKILILVIALILGFLIESTVLRFRNTMPFLGNILIKRVFLASIYPFIIGLLLFYDGETIRFNKKNRILVLTLLIIANVEPIFFWLIPNLIEVEEIYGAIPVYGWNRIEYLSPVLSMIAAYCASRPNEIEK